MINLPSNIKKRLISTTNTFVGAYSNGKYIFTGTQKIFDVLPNTAYFIDILQLSGTIPESLYLSILDVTPLLLIKRTATGEPVADRAIPLLLFSQAKPITSFVTSDKAGDSICGTISGSLTQDSTMIGITSVDLIMSLTLYAIDDKEFNRAFQDIAIGARKW